MEYDLIIRPEAKTDLLDAFHWYQEQNPLIHKVIGDGIRRSVTRRFPFGVFYLIENERIIILAVLHARRDPMKWKKRI